MNSNFHYGTIYRLCSAREYFPELDPGFECFEVAVTDGIPEPWVILRAPCTNILLVSRRFDLATSLGCPRGYQQVVSRLQEMAPWLSPSFPLSVFDPTTEEAGDRESAPMTVAFARYCFGRRHANDVY